MNQNNNPNDSNNHPLGDGKGSSDAAIHSASSSQDTASLQRSQSDVEDINRNNMSLLALLARGSSLPDLRATREPLPPSLQLEEVDPPVAPSIQDPFRFLRSILDQAILTAVDRFHGEGSENTEEHDGDEVQVERRSDERRRPPKQ
jgi:hypothetical protein